MNNKKFFFEGNPYEFLATMRTTPTYFFQIKIKYRINLILALIVIIHYLHIVVLDN